MNSPGVAVMSGGTSKAREARPDVLSHRIFSRPDQPPLQARHSYRNIKGHKCTHAGAHTHSSRVTSTRHRPAHTPFSKRGVTSPLKILGALHMSPQSIICHCAADKVAVFRAAC